MTVVALLPLGWRRLSRSQIKSCCGYAKRLISLSSALSVLPILPGVWVVSQYCACAAAAAP